MKHLETAKGNCPKSLILKAMDKSKNVVGQIELSGIDHFNQNASLTRVLVAPFYRENGYGQEMVKRVLEIRFKKLRLHRIDLRVFDFNKAAIKCYENCGFKKEGLLRDAHKSPNGYWSLYQMRILEHEWFKNQHSDIRFERDENNYERKFRKDSWRLCNLPGRLP